MKVKLPNLTDTKATRQATYKLVTSVLPVLVRFSNSTGITDINQLSDYILLLSVDEFCDYKFNDNIG